MSHWERLARLPRMACGGSGACGGCQEAEAGEDRAARQPPLPDLRYSLLHQKLQLLDLCIHLQQQQRQHEDEDSGGMEPASPSSSQASFRSAREESDSGSPDKREALANGGSRRITPDPGTQDASASAAAEEVEQPLGVAGELPNAQLLRRPDVPLRVPHTQQPPPATEDQLQERQAALAQLEAGGGCGGTEGGLPVRDKVQGRMLLSDMQAFKAANPGCCLADFVRWHSPRDWRPGGGLSERMAAPGNAWARLWAAAIPLPAAAQRPLFDPVAEAERVLHFLETIPPAALYNELLALGVSAAAGLLAASDGGSLPSAAAQLEVLERTAGLLLQAGTRAASQAAERQREVEERGGHAGGGGGGAAAGEGERDGEADWPLGGRRLARLPSALADVYAGALSRQRYEALLRLLACAEQVAVAGQSLLLRLCWTLVPEAGGGGGSRCDSSESGSSSGGSASAAQTFAVRCTVTPQALRVADALLAVALGERAPESSCGAATAVCLTPDERHEAAVLMGRRWPEAALADADAEETSSEGAEAAGPWADPFQREWLVEVVSGNGAGSSGGSPEDGERVQQRLYVKSLPAELRIATLITDELPCL